MTVSVSPRDLSKPTPAPQAPLRQQNTTETPPTTEATEKGKDDFLSPKFAALARQEKAIRAERARLKAEKDELERQKSAQLNGYIPKDKLKADPLAAFEEAGLSYDDIAKRLIEAPQSEVDPTIRTLQAKIAELEANQQSLTKKAEETQTTAYKQALDTIRNKVSGLVEKNPEFEMIKALGQTEAVVALIEETFKAEGYVMTEEEAAKEVEEHLAEEALKMARLEKIQKRLAPAIPEQEKPQQPKQQQLTTLTHSLNSAPTGRRLTEAQRRANAIAVAQGQPKPYN
jgi:hypothetical protein